MFLEIEVVESVVPRVVASVVENIVRRFVSSGVPWLVASVVVVWSLVLGGVAAVAAGPCWAPPVGGAVVDPFRVPDCRWCAGNRGIDFDTTPGEPVRAVTAGLVTFSGVIAGIGYVVTDVGGGRRITYGGLVDRRPREGDVVAEGAVLGSAGTSLHLGLRFGDRYVDPTPYLGRPAGRPRLVPTDGRPAAVSRPVLRCGGAADDSFR